MVTNNLILLFTFLKLINFPKFISIFPNDRNFFTLEETNIIYNNKNVSVRKTILIQSKLQKPCITISNANRDIIVVYSCGENEYVESFQSSLYIFDRKKQISFHIDMVKDGIPFIISKIWLIDYYVLIFIKNLLVLKIYKNYYIEYRTLIVKEIFIDAIYENFNNIVFIGESMTMYKLSSDKTEIIQIDDDVINPKWQEGKNTIWFLTKNNENFNLKIYKLEMQAPQFFEKEIIYFNIYKKIVCFLKFENKKPVLKFIINDAENLALFPYNYNFDNISSLYFVDDNIFIITRVFEFYDLLVGSIKDIKFTRIYVDVLTDNVHNNKNNYFLNFVSFQGVVFLFLQDIFNKKRYTYGYISYNNAKTWKETRFAKTSKSDICEEKKCRIKFTGKNINEIFKYNEKYPNIIISKGLFEDLGMKMETRYIVSINGGLDWYSIKIKFSQIKFVNNGEIFIAIDNLNRTTYLSFDYGQTWKNIKLDFHQIFELIPGNSPNDFYVGLITKNLKTGQITFYELYFRNFLSRFCGINDYSISYLGPDQNSNCYQGIKQKLAIKIKDSLCVNDLKKIKIYPGKCLCHDDDFECNFPTSNHHGICFNHNHEFCFPGSFIIRDINTKRLENYYCLINDKNYTKEIDICKLTINHNNIVIKQGKKLKFIDLDTFPNLKIYDLPVEIDCSVEYRKFILDRETRCVYFLVRMGIISKCYSYKTSFKNIPEILIVNDETIKGFDLNPFMHYLLYYNNSFIILLDLRSGYRKTFEETIYIIVSVFFNTENLKITAYYYNKNKNHLVFCDDIINVNSKKIFSMDNIKSFRIFENEVYISTYQNYYFHIKDGKLNNIEFDIKDIITIKKLNDIKLIVLNNAIWYQNKVYYLKNIIAVNLIPKMKYILEEGCKYSDCDQLCLSMGKEEYICLCSDGMVYDKITKKCKCSGIDKCKICNNDQFVCNSGSCVSIFARCNGVSDCDDDSDEKYCYKTCGTDQFSCDGTIKCFSLSNICNNISECRDEIDEKFCKTYYPKCKKFEFECLNNQCIDNKNVCDGKSDCNDSSDEFGCKYILHKCKQGEFKCDDGTCIDENNVCDGNFNCNDFSDENGCHPTIMSHGSINCLLKINEKCIDNKYICNHHVDALHAIDEINCNHPTGCLSNEYILCDDHSLCIKRDKVCDNFHDCLDGSDEINCETPKSCSLNDIIICNNKVEICVKDLCDKKIDCHDGSDEKFCDHLIYVNRIYMVKMPNGFVSFHWIMNVDKYETTRVLVILDKSKQVIHMQQTDSRNITIGHHITCNHYRIEITTLSNGITKMFQYVYYRPEYSHPPHNYIYRFQTQTLYWDYNIPNCLPRIFYIECKRQNKIVYRNFSISNSHKMPSSDLICQVASCPTSVFNDSCSSFLYTVSKPVETGIKYMFIVINTLTVLILVLCLVFSLKYGRFIIKALKYQRIILFPKKKIDMLDIFLAEKEIQRLSKSSSLRFVNI